jgi:hypothetical protein
MPSFSNEVIFNQNTHFLIFRVKAVNSAPPPPRHDLELILKDKLGILSSTY